MIDYAAEFAGLLISIFVLTEQLAKRLKVSLFMAILAKKKEKHLLWNDKIES